MSNILEMKKVDFPVATPSVVKNVKENNEEKALLNFEKAENPNSLKAWFDDQDKVSTDGCDDGKISFKEGLASYGKGLIGIVKSVKNHPIKTLACIGAGVGIGILTGGAALPLMAVAGAAVGAGSIVYGGYKAITAKTDGEAKQAFETMGNGTFALAASAVGSKQALNSAANAGVKSANGLATNNPITNLANCAKVAPEALSVSARNAKANLLTLTTGKIHAHCNELREDTMPYKSKPNDVQAYRFNPNGTPEEILANNPGVFQGEDGCFYVKNKWDASAPFKIDTSKEQMIMMYDGMADMAVCDGEVFAGSYVDTAAFKADGTLNYQNPASLEYGKVIDATKQAFGKFKMFELGTEIETLEGVNVIDPGEIVSIDHAGNPYVVMMAKQSQKVDFIPKAS